MGSITEAMVTHARRDIMLVKLVGEPFYENILLPTAGGEHAQCAEQYGVALADELDGKLTVCNVSPSTPPENGFNPADNLRNATDRLRQINPRVEIDQKILRGDVVSERIIQEAQNHDVVMVGAAGKSIYPKILFGSIPEETAQLSDKTVIVVKRYNPVKALPGRVVGE